MSFLPFMGTRMTPWNTRTWLSTAGQVHVVWNLELPSPAGPEKGRSIPALENVTSMLIPAELQRRKESSGLSVKKPRACPSMIVAREAPPGLLN